MQLTKTCARCAAELPVSKFLVRSASSDGLTAACGACIRDSKQTSYWLDPAERRAASARASAAKNVRFARDPAYKRAFNLWGSTKKRGTKIPPWVAIADFVPVCAQALRGGPDYHVDHVIPLNHPLVCGLHVPGNVRAVPRAINHKKCNSWEPD